MAKSNVKKMMDRMITGKPAIKPKEGKRRSKFMKDMEQFPHFTQAFPEVAYKRSSLRSKRSHLLTFQYWHSEFIDIRGGPVGKKVITREVIQEFGLFLAKEGFARQSVIDYCGTIKQYFVDSDLIKESLMLEAKLKRAGRLWKLACMKHSVQKAELILRTDMEKLVGEDKRVLRWWFQSGLRTSSLGVVKCTFKDEPVVPRDKKLKTFSPVNVWIPNFKYLDAGCDNVIKIRCGCISTKTKPILTDTEWCCFHAEDSPGLPTLPIQVKDATKLLESLGATGHSVRRTLAMAIRKRMEEEKVMNPAFLGRVNSVLKWGRSSNLLKYYTTDYKAALGLELPEVGDQLWDFLVGTDNKEISKGMKKSKKAFQGKFRKWDLDGSADLAAQNGSRAYAEILRSMKV